MGQVLRLVEFGDGDEPPEDAKYECPACGGVHFEVWESLAARCIECGQDLDLDGED